MFQAVRGSHFLSRFHAKGPYPEYSRVWIRTFPRGLGGMSRRYAAKSIQRAKKFYAMLLFNCLLCG